MSNNNMIYVINVNFEANVNFDMIIYSYDELTSSPLYNINLGDVVNKWQNEVVTLATHHHKAITITPYMDSIKDRTFRLYITNMDGKTPLLMLHERLSFDDVVSEKIDNIVKAGIYNQQQMNGCRLVKKGDSDKNRSYLTQLFNGASVPIYTLSYIEPDTFRLVDDVKVMLELN